MLEVFDDTWQNGGENVIEDLFGEQYEITIVNGIEKLR